MLDGRSRTKKRLATDPHGLLPGSRYKYSSRRRPTPLPTGRRIDSGIFLEDRTRGELG